MKKLILFALMALLPMVASAKEYELYCSVNDKSTGGPFFEDSSVRFEFRYIPFSYFIKVKVINKTNERIYIEWENARISDRQICFGTDNAFSFNNTKSDEVVHSKSSSQKEVGRRVDPEYMGPLFHESSLKNGGRSVNSIIIPIKYPSGKIIDYKVYVCLRYK